VKKTNSIGTELPRCLFDNKSRLANTLQGTCKLNVLSNGRGMYSKVDIWNLDYNVK
jgi:hypothetical protein